MKTMTMLLASGAMGVVGFAAQADETGPCENCADTMTIVSWGGAYQESQLKAYVQPYQKMHPEVKVSWDPSGAEAVAKLRAQNEAGNITWDLVDATGADNLRLCDEGLFREIDYDNELADGDDGSTATEDFGDGLISDCYIPQIVYSTTFGYRTDMVPEGVEPPSNICDVFDLEKYPGKRSLEKRPVNNLEWALMCSGVDKADIYDVLATPEGQEQALAKLDEIKDQTVWWSAGADTPQLLADGEIFMGSTYNGRLFSVIEEQKQPVGMMWDGQVFDYDGWGVPTGLEEDHLNRVMHFLRFATDTQRLADQASYISYGPGRASSAALVGKHAELGIDMAPHMPTDPANMTNVLQPNFTFWADYRDDIDAQFQAWLAQ